MPAIDLTEEQRRRLETVRTDIEDAFVDTYGHTELSDAIDYLLDTYTPPANERADMEQIAAADYTSLQRVATDVDGVPGSGISADEMRGQLLAALGPETLAARLAGDDETAGKSTNAGASDGAEASDVIQRDDGDGAGNSQGDGATDNSERAGDNGDADDRDAKDDGNTDDSGGVTVGNPASGDVLSAANRLLDENDDKWRKPENSDTPYEVDLPDGTTEGVRTKDDVRQLLFRHYS